MSTILECRGLSKRYGHKQALDQVDLSLESGRIIGLLGPNGSGKTTLIKLINNLLSPSEGTLLIDGQEPGMETKKIISYLPERTYLDENQRVTDAIDFFADFYEDFDRSRAMGMLERLSIDPSQRIKTLSKGTREKVQLILVMSRRAKLYCLDEPIAGVDPAARDYILDTIINNYDENATILISTHMVIFSAVVFTVIFLGFRFYRNVFTDQGYLTNTLPVTPSQIILSKGLVGIIWEVLDYIIVLAAILVLSGSRVVFEEIGIAVREGLYLLRF